MDLLLSSGGKLDAASFAASFATLHELGRGRFGEVALVRHEPSGEHYALKKTRFGTHGQPDSQVCLSCYSHSLKPVRPGSAARARENANN